MIQKNLLGRLHAFLNSCNEETVDDFFFFFVQDERLKKLVEQHGPDAWRLIANYFPVSNKSHGRNAKLSNYL